MTTMTRHDAIPGVNLPSLRRIAAGWTAFRAARRETSRITRELDACTDRELADLGLFRHDIPAIARGAYRR